MCGIFGIVKTPKSDIDKLTVSKIFNQLLILSESRGKEASGAAITNLNETQIIKAPCRASKLIDNSIFEKAAKPKENSLYHTAIGHSRLVTNGFENDNLNNQPVLKHNTITVHNGIIVNESSLWEKYGQSERISKLDSELIPTIFNRSFSKKPDFCNAIEEVYKNIYGMASIAMLFETYDNLLLATNNGSLYYLPSINNNTFIFASERMFLLEITKQKDLANTFSASMIQQLKPMHACLVSLKNAEFHVSQMQSHFKEEITENRAERNPHKETNIEITDFKSINNPFITYNSLVPDTFNKEIAATEKKVAELKRCSKCLLPETFPFITFDNQGVCNYCHNYKKNEVKGENALHLVADKYRKANNEPECLVPFSGGRDSSFALHYIKKELGLKPIAFSYDWGMLTDLSRRNQSRLCGKLGVEHILISADIRKKRKNIRKNVLAWLRRPRLGTIPLFMAGDKQYFYFANLLMRQNDLHLSVLGENLLETTNFKTGFCGIKPQFNASHTYTLSSIQKVKMASFYGKEYLLNPKYLNSSLLDTLDAFKAYYLIKHNNLNIFDYIPWEQERVEQTILNNYEWETDPGTATTWRIGDGTAAFYNYIYYVIAGFTENDTFRSNQIREGQISRKTAMKMIENENAPRWESIKWYCNIINIDFEETIRTINNIPTLF